jgi:hypothetical protein
VGHAYLSPDVDTIMHAAISRRTGSTSSISRCGLNPVVHGSKRFNGRMNAGGVDGKSYRQSERLATRALLDVLGINMICQLITRRVFRLVWSWWLARVHDSNSDLVLLGNPRGLQAVLTTRRLPAVACSRRLSTACIVPRLRPLAQMRLNGDVALRVRTVNTGARSARR